MAGYFIVAHGAGTWGQGQSHFWYDGDWRRTSQWGMNGAQDVFGNDQQKREIFMIGAFR